MDLSAIAQMLVAKWPLAGIILSVLGALVVVGQTIVAITPSQSDDAAWEKIKSIPVVGSIVSLLSNFAPVQKK